MPTGIIDISNVINVSLTNLPSGRDLPNPNSLALFTTEQPDNLDPYNIYLNPGDVAEAYGTNSVTYEMAVAIFSQAPNILSGGGRLVTIPLIGAVSGTPGNFTTASLTANLAALILVDDGDLKVTLNGTAINLTGIDFTSATTLANIVTILQGLLPNAIVELVGSTIKISSKKVGDSADVVLAAVSGGAGTNLAAAGYFNTSAGAATSGANASGETLLAAIARTKNAVQYAGVITDLNMEDAVVLTTANGIQAEKMMFLHHFASVEDIAGIGTSVKNASDTKTRCLLYTIGLEEANLMKAAYAGRGFSVDFSGSRTTQTLNLKTLATIEPDTGISQANYTAAKTAGMDMYISYSGEPSIVSTGGNKYFDSIYNGLWFQFALETAGFNFLRQTSTKVLQTEEGMDGLKGAYRKVCKQAVRNGYFGTGLQWNSAELFGNPEDLRRNITDEGFYIYSLPVALQSQADRETRDAPLVQIAGKEGGAIQSSNVNAIIEQ
jgi:hypothetical protein